MSTGREWMQDMQLDSTLNEKMLFCCTPQQSLARVRLGFGADERTRSSGRLGYGIYFSESASRAEAWEGPGSPRADTGEDLYLTLCRVCLGCPLSTGECLRDIQGPGCYYGCKESSVCAHLTHDSLVSNDRDFCVYRGDVCYPEFMLRYRIVSQEEAWQLDLPEAEEVADTARRIPILHFSRDTGGGRSALAPPRRPVPRGPLPRCSREQWARGLRISFGHTRFASSADEPCVRWFPCRGATSGDH